MSSIDFPLRTSLRVEPLRGDEVGGLIGQERAVRSIVEYLAEHGEGRFLISGFQGVGKSSLIRRVIYDLQRHPFRHDRSMVVLELRTHSIEDPQVIGKRLVWHLRWEVEEGRIQMDSHRRARLLDAFEGVAASTVERESELSEGIGASAGLSASANLSVEASQTSTRKRKAVYVPYDVNTSLLELGQLIAGLGRFTAAESRPWWKRLFAPSPAVTKPPLVVVVLDRVATWEVLHKLNNLFATTGAVFLIVVPPEVRSEWIRQEAAGHDPLAGFQDAYLNCLWDDLPRLLERYVDIGEASKDATALYPKLIGFLTFASGGVPRRCVQILLKYKQKDDRGHAVVRFDRRAVRTIEFYDRLFTILSKREKEILGDYFANYEDADRDRARRCMIASAREIISKGSIPRENPLSTMIELAEALRPPERQHIVRALIRVLVAEGLLIAQGGDYTLSVAARDQVAEGRNILGTGILPRIEIPTERDVMAPLPAPTPPGARQPSHAAPGGPGESVVTSKPPEPVSEAGTLVTKTIGVYPGGTDDVFVGDQTSGRCGQCGAHYQLTWAFCPRCGAERIETRTGEYRAASDKTLARLGEALGRRYEVDRLIGRGGMGSVYLATDRELKRKLAVKVLSPELSFGADIRTRFQAEALYAARLQHPNIAAIFDIGTQLDLVYYLMPYIEGGSLESRVAEHGPLTLAEAVELLAPIAAALGYAHEQGIVHRDVKPGNILIEKRGHAMLCDFGIAKATSEAGTLTASGTVIGTPHFMSPEQARGAPIAPASDQYSFAVVLYFALTGRHLFEGDSIFSIIMAHAQGEPPRVSELLPRPVPELDEMMLRMLAKQPADRYSSMEDVRQRLLKLPSAKGALS